MPTLQDKLKEVLDYDPMTGILTNKVYRNRMARAGDAAGTTDYKGYIRVGFNKQKWLAHRLAFLWMTGTVPEQVDHKNRVKDDNRWDNIRPADGFLNAKNKGKLRNNTSGHTGVHFCNVKHKFIAQLRRRNVQYHLGQFNTMNEAIAARAAGELKYG